MRRTVVCLCVCLSVGAVRAEEKSSVLDMSKEELIQKVLDLEKRLGELEKKNAAPKAAETAKPAETPEKPKAASPSLSASWKDGLTFSSADKSFSVKVGGRLQYDLGFFPGADSEVEKYLTANKLGTLDDSLEFRRARIHILGTIYDNVEFKAEYDFAGSNTVKFKDVYVGLINLPYVGGIRVGQFKEPFGLEEITSDLFVTFMERSLANTLVPSYNPGIMVYNTAFDQRMTWAFGVFRDDNDAESGFARGDGKYNFTGRITGLPWYEDEGAKLAHLGVAYSHRSPNDTTKVRFRTRPEAHLAPYYVSTPEFAAGSVDLVGTEAAVVYGTASLQGEYMHAFTDSPVAALNDPDLSGFYVMAGYFLTGEHRAYKTTTGAFDRIKPKQNFMDGKGGWGAWEVAVRFSQVDLKDVPGPMARELSDFTFGLNWYLNPNTKVQWNFIFADIEGIGDSNIFQMRFQIDF